MNQEIKFRAWDKEKKEMREVRDISWDAHGNLDFSYSCDPIGEYHGSSNTLMQFTGREDKTGREVYEGDLLRVDGCEAVQVIIWIGARISIFSTPDNDDYEDLWRVESKDMEVIGNIFENPELLKN